MKIGFFLVLRTDPVHFLHAASLVREARRYMPGVETVQLTDGRTPVVPDVTTVERIESQAPLLDQRLTHYANRSGAWLLLDTDVSIRASVRGVFDDLKFDVALVDRYWPHAPQGEGLMHTMPFNTGVVFSRSAAFWQAVLEHWRAQSDAYRADWMSEQSSVYAVVRTGTYRVKILPGMAYNYPPADAKAVVPPLAALVHYKGPRKAWLSPHATQVLAR